MSNELEQVRPGLYVRKNRPRDVRLSADFVTAITRRSESKVFKQAVEEIARASKRG
jgi:hypothetical protein